MPVFHSSKSGIYPSKIQWPAARWIHQPVTLSSAQCWTKFELQPVVINQSDHSEESGNQSIWIFGSNKNTLEVLRLPDCIRNDLSQGIQKIKQFFGPRCQSRPNHWKFMFLDCIHDCCERPGSNTQQYLRLDPIALKTRLDHFIRVPYLHMPA